MRPIDETIKPYVCAGFSGIYVRSAEPEEAAREITRLCCKEGWEVATWDLAQGLRWPLKDNEGSAGPVQPDPLVPVKAFAGLEGNGPRLVLLHNYHRFLDNVQVMQHLLNALVQGKGSQKFYVILSPVLQLPAELEKAFVLLDHRLPDAAALSHLANAIRELPPNEPVAPEIVLAAKGLTRREAEDAFALSLYEHDAILPEVVWGIKTQAVAKKGHLEVYRGKEGFASLGGLQGLKDFSKALLRAGQEERARGLLLLGPSGTGKSAFAKALGNEVGRPTLLLDLGRVHHKHVGQSEENIREALEMADAMSPCVLMIDEGEKGLSGAGSDGDGGVSSRILGTLLTWLNDHESEVVTLITTNNIQKLPPEFSRAERFDAVFFIDLPTRDERTSIWKMYKDLYQLTDSAFPMGTQEPLDDEGYTGAEVKSCCRLARMLGKTIKEAAEHVVPVSVSAAEQLASLRQWASGRCLSAATGGKYQLPARAKVREVASSRKVERRQK